MTSTNTRRGRVDRLLTEGDVLRALRTGTYTLQQLYGICELRTTVARGGGHDPVPGHGSDTRWKHRVRSALANMQRSGRARLGRTGWVIQGTPEHPTRFLLVVAGATPEDFELRLRAAVDLLGQLDGPVDLVLADPPWGLRRGQGRFSGGHGYRRDHTRVVPGYVDVAPDRYAEFTWEWVSAAAKALRPGGQLAVVTGPQRAAIVQCTAEAAGLTWISSIAARKDAPLPTTRRPSCSHWTITILCSGSRDHPRRVYNPPDDLPRAASGHPYPTDWWPVNGSAARPGLYRYDNALPLRLAERIVHCFSDPGEHVVVPFIGSGTEVVACWRKGRLLTAGDVNPGAVRFAAARLLVEHAWPEDRQPALLPYPL